MKCAVWMVTLVEDLYFNLLGKMTSCRKLSVRSPLRYKWRISLNFISGFLTLRSYKFGLEVHLRFPYFKKLHVWSWKNVERRRSSVFKESSFPCVCGYLVIRFNSPTHVWWWLCLSSRIRSMWTRTWRWFRRLIRSARWLEQWLVELVWHLHSHW